MTVSAVSPCRMALQRERRLPSSVRGPVLLSAFNRLASICLRELIRGQDGLGFGSVKFASDTRLLALVADASDPRSSWQSRADRFSGLATRPLRCPHDAVPGDDRGRAGP